MCNRSIRSHSNFSVYRLGSNGGCDPPMPVSNGSDQKLDDGIIIMCRRARTCTNACSHASVHDVSNNCHYTESPPEVDRYTFTTSRVETFYKKTSCHHTGTFYDMCIVNTIIRPLIKAPGDHQCNVKDNLLTLHGSTFHDVLVMT